MVTCWERADLLALVCDVKLCLVIFPCGILGQLWYLIEVIPDLCHLSYVNKPKCFKMGICLKMLMDIQGTLMAESMVSYKLI